MDRNQFDRLSRLVAAGGSRRDALRILLGGAVVGAAATVESAAAKKRDGKGKRARRRKLRSQQEQPLCPATCTRNCATVPIRGGANLTRCNLSDRNLDGINLGGANLTNVCFEDASLRNVSFRGANVSGACFCNADLRGADFRGTRITAAQLACAKPGCDTILPNGKRAIVCGGTETCCDGICVNTRNDPDNCGVCGNACGLCQGCAGGTCEDLPDGLFDCDGQPLVPADSRPGFCFTSGGLCTATTRTGICDGGMCNCGPLGVYDPAANVCGCNLESQETCDEIIHPGGCCEIDETCLANGEYCNGLNCLEPPCS